MADIFPAETTVEWSWSTSGTPTIDRSLSGLVQWQWGTQGLPLREYSIASPTVEWEWSAGSVAPDRQELFFGAGLQLSAYHLSDLDNPIAIVPFEEAAFEDALSQVTGGSATIGIEWFDSSWLDTDILWRINVEGVERFGFLTQDYRDFKVSKDGKRIELSGRSLDTVLGWATIAPEGFGTPTSTITRRFTAARGAILWTLIHEAQDRGAIPMVELIDWNETHGSTGQEWSTFPELEFNAGSDLLEKVSEWSDLDFEWHMDSRFGLRVAEQLGRDLQDHVRLYPAHHVTDQQVTKSFRDLRTALFTQDGNDGVSLISDPDAVDEWGWREQYVVFSEAVAEGDRTANGYALMNTLKDPTVERIIEIDPFTDGRRPFVDFNLGDRVSVMFDQVPYGFRVLAISMKAKAGQGVTCEVVLEDMIEAARRRRERLTSSSGGGGVSSGQSTIYAETVGAVSLTTNPTDLCLLTLNAFVSTYGKVSWMLSGTASGPLDLRVELFVGSAVIREFRYEVPRAGRHDAQVTWFWPSISTGTYPLFIRVRTDTGTFALENSGDGQLWVEAKGIQGASMGSADIYVTDEAPGATNLIGATDSVSFSHLTVDDQPTVGESVTDSPYTITDSVGPTESGEIILGYEQVVATNPEDGTTSSTGSFSNSATTSVVGNIAGTLHGSWWRFDLPSGADLTGVEVVDAYLSITADATGSVPTRTRFTLADDPDPDNVADRTDFLGRARVSGETTWEMIPTTGTRYRTPNMVDLVQALVDDYGDLESLLVFAEDNTSLPNGSSTWRARDHALNTPPVLTIQFLPA